MKVAAKYHNCDPRRALAVALLDNARIEALKIGESRRELRLRRQTWSKFSKRWGIFHRLLWFIWSDNFAKMVDALDQDLEAFRRHYLQALAVPDAEGSDQAAATKLCPRCKQLKAVDTGFGYRLVKGQIRAQSWCRSCR